MNEYFNHVNQNSGFIVHQLRYIRNTLKSDFDTITRKSMYINTELKVLINDLKTRYNQSKNQLIDEIEYDEKLYKDTLIDLEVLMRRENLLILTQYRKLMKICQKIDNMLEYRKLIRETNIENNTDYDIYI